MNRPRFLLIGLLLLGLALLLSILRGPASAQDKPADQRAKWEYKSLHPNNNDFQDALNSLNKEGDEGWELAGVVSEVYEDSGRQVHSRYSMILKRPKR